MDKLIKMIEISVRSDVRIHQIEKKYYAGEITSEEAYDQVIAEADRAREQLKAIREMSVKEYDHMVRGQI